MEISEVKEILEDFFGEERVEVSNYNGTHKQVLIHFPKATVTNEEGQSIDITHLFVKFNVSNTGLFASPLNMIRSEYTRAQATVGYSHSHLHTFGEVPSFSSPCLGRGPLNHTILSISRTPNEDLWKLFCLELKKFVETESIAGIPYIQLRTVSTRSLAKYTLLVYEDYSTYTENFVKFVASKRPFDFNIVDQKVSVAMSLPQLVITMSNLFIEWCNEHQIDNWVDYLMDGIYKDGVIKIPSGYSSHLLSQRMRRTGEVLLRFKGRDIVYTITDDEEEEGTENLLKVLKPGFLKACLKELLLRANYLNGVQEITERRIYV